MVEKDSRTRLAWLLLALLVTLSVVLGILVLSGDGGSWGPTDHPRFPTMQRSGWSWEGNSVLLASVWLLGVLQIVLSLCLLGLGLSGKEGLGRLRFPVLAGGLLHAGIFSWMMLAHLFPVAPSLWSFPPPTVVMLFFLWLLPPFYFVMLYVAVFDRWILTKESQRNLLRQVNSRQGQGGG